MEVYAGIDWAREFHVMGVVDPHGVRLFDGSFPHTRAGLDDLVTKLREVQGEGQVMVGIELSRGVVVERLSREGITVFPVHPNHVVSARGCFGAAANKNDRKDAYILAEIVRTGRQRLRELELGAEETRRMKRLDDHRQEMLNENQRACQRLGGLLTEVFPAAIGLFSDLDALISLAFLKAWPTAKAAEELTVGKLRAFFRRHKYSGGTTAEELLAMIKAGAASVAVTDADEFVVREKVEHLRQLGEKLKHIEKEIERVVSSHSLYEIYESLPGIATTSVAALIANLGDLATFSCAEDLQAAAGVVPIVRQSGKSSCTLFRRARNKNIQRVLTSFADLSRRKDPWAAGIYAAAKARGKRHSHAIRILARAWTLVIFRMVKDRATYNPDKRKQRTA